MTRLQWDTQGQKAFETGLDQGVLYLPNGNAVPWNGLTGIDEDAPEGTTPLYFDGIKYGDEEKRSDFSGTIKAYTYPNSFKTLSGQKSVGIGMYASGQRKSTFGLSFRTKIQNDITEDLGHRIHILYNLTANETDFDYRTLSEQNVPLEFSWKLDSVPEVVTGYVPTAHAIIDTTRMRKELLQELEGMLYGDANQNGSLPPLDDLIQYSTSWNLIFIAFDYESQTWTASSNYPGYIVDNGDGTFQINEANATYSDANTYTISSTKA